MQFLIITVIAVVILVALVIRRLPYLRHYRLGLEIAAPKPYIQRSTSFVETLWHQIQSFFSQSIGNKRPVFPGHTMPEAPLRSSVAPKGTNDFPMTAHPGDFWQEEPMTSAHDPLELPSQGLITRRGESQKIAHELITHADEAFRKKDFKEAERYYLQAATKDPDNARIYNRLGVIYLQTKSYKDAIESFRRALKFDDRVASRHFNLALAYLGKRDYRSAEKSLRESLRLEPTNDKYRKTLEAIHKQAI